MATQSPGRSSPVYFSDNVEFVKNVPDVEGAGARIVGDHLYMSTSEGVRIFDIKNPLKPTLVGSEEFLLPYAPGTFASEDPDTNGQTMVVGSGVYDVSDVRKPEFLGYWGSPSHTSTCVLDCRYAYDSEGVIMDLAVPAEPRHVGNWNKATPATWAHDLTEVSPGVVVTASEPLMVLDAREDPLHPAVLAVGEVEVDEFVHGLLWPRQGNDRYLLAGGEDLGPRCDVEVDNRKASFVTYDTRGWRRSQQLHQRHSWAPPHGTFTDGNAPANQFCGHWFDDHPTFRNGGLVAAGWYEHGTQFLSVSQSGKIKRVGFFTPLGGAASAAYWVTDRIVYVVDYMRGLDILRYTGPL
jgi:hypothetical protein